MKSMNTWLLEAQCGLHKDLCCVSDSVNPGLYAKLEELQRTMSRDELLQFIKFVCQCQTASCPVPTPPAPVGPPMITPPNPPPPAITPTCPNLG